MNKPVPTSVLEAQPDRFGTHRVLNQALPATHFNAFNGNVALRNAI